MTTKIRNKLTAKGYYVSPLGVISEDRDLGDIRIRKKKVVISPSRADRRVEALTLKDVLGEEVPFRDKTNYP